MFEVTRDDFNKRRAEGGYFNQSRTYKELTSLPLDGIRLPLKVWLEVLVLVTISVLQK